MSTVIFDPQYVKVKYSILMDSEFCSLKSVYLFMRINWMSFKKRVQYCICPAEDMLSLDWEIMGCVIYRPGLHPAIQRDKA